MDPHEQDFYDAMELLCNEEWPYESPVHAKLVTSWSSAKCGVGHAKECVILLIQLLNEEKWFGVHLFYEQKSLVPPSVRANPLLKRYVLYQQYHEEGLKDIAIFRRMFEQESKSFRGGNFLQYHNMMRSWKKRYITPLSSLNFTLFDKISKFDYRAKTTGKTKSVRKAMQKLSRGHKGNTSIVNIVDRYNAYAKCEKTDRTRLFLNFLQSVIVCIQEDLEAFKVLHKNINNEIELLNTVMLAVYPKFALICKGIKENAKVPYLKRIHSNPVNNDTYRGIVKTVERYYKVCADALFHSLQRYKYAIAKKIYEKMILPDIFPADIIYTAPVVTMFVSEKIRTWRELWYHANIYYPNAGISQMLLLRIFKICSRKNGFKSNEVKEKIAFNILQCEGFFDDLHNRLAKTAHIKVLQGIRWHKVPIPRHMAIYSATGYIYSPLWEKKQPRVREREKKKRHVKHKNNRPNRPESL